jgi:hypothetical protein
MNVALPLLVILAALIAYLATTGHLPRYTAWIAAGAAIVLAAVSRRRPPTVAPPVAPVEPVRREARYVLRDIAARDQARIHAAASGVEPEDRLAEIVNARRRTPPGAP